MLFARVGTPHCPDCDAPIHAESPERITNMILQKYEKKMVTIAAPIAVEKKGEFKNELKRFFEKGFARFVINKTDYKFKDVSEIEKINLNKNFKHNISVIIDKIEAAKDDSVRLQEAVEKAFGLNGGLCSIIDSNGKELMYSSKRVCIPCVRSFPELEPRIFSFNSPLGACKHCHGLGFTYESPWTNSDASFKNDDDDIGGHSAYFNFGQREKICDYCNGKRLNDEALAVKIDGKNIAEFCDLSISRLLEYCKKLQLPADQQQIAEPLLREIISRLTFLENVGLSYLTISLSARTLSGGEGQRIRLATQIGSALSGVLYILDEPSIGLHQRDNDRLINTLKLLRDQGNTVVVVEHDMDTICQADYVVDIGPGAGVLGGNVTGYGTPKELADNEKSLTGAFIAGRRQILIPKTRRSPKGFLKLKGAHANNLKNINVDIPVGVLSAVSGVSGSGKSSLVMQTLASGLLQYFKRGWAISKNFEELEGVEQLSNVVLVDQSPIGRTPRSNPATYLGIFDEIRNLYANLPESNARGYKPGRFSFNVADGRCFECNGEGSIKVAMHFLEDVHMTCKSCGGSRYNYQTLEIKYKNKNIAEILDMSITEAVEFFATFPRIKKRLDLLCEVGLDYIKLGQSSTTFSGGEAQRIKLVNELAKRDHNTMYILDEPTTGLHSSDVEKLLQVLNKLVDRGNTVLVIEHNLDILKSVDYLIDIGPEGGEHGGELVAAGTPETIAVSKKSLTGSYLKKVLR